MIIYQRNDKKDYDFSGILFLFSYYLLSRLHLTKYAAAPIAPKPVRIAIVVMKKGTLSAYFCYTNFIILIYAVIE